MDHVQYRKGSGDSSDNFMYTQNMVMPNYIAILQVMEDSLPTIHVLINNHS